MSRETGKRIVIFGATGHLGQQLIDKLDETDWPIAELVGVASAASAGAEFSFRGEDLDVVGESPTLHGRDLVFICTPAAQALDIVREALRAEVPCIDCSGALANQPDVPMPGPIAVGSAVEGSNSNASQDDRIAPAPLLSVASGTTLAWARILEALPVSRVVGTVLASSAAHGRGGVLALSQESIALFNQSESPEPGPAKQPVAFDVIPGGGIDCERAERECRRLFGDDLRIDITSLQVPTFVGEGASIALELQEPMSVEAIEERLAAIEGLVLERDSLDFRDLVSLDEERVERVRPTLRDAIGSDEVLVGRIEADGSRPADEAWRLWISFDPLRLVADQALRIAARRLGLA